MVEVEATGSGGGAVVVVVVIVVFFGLNSYGLFAKMTWVGVLLPYMLMKTELVGVGVVEGVAVSAREPG